MSAKPLDETWRVGSKVGRTLYRGDGPDDIIGLLDTREAAKLAAAAPELARALIEAEWSARVGRDNDAACPSCEEWECTGGRHAEDCLLDAALRKAGLR